MAVAVLLIIGAMALMLTRLFIGPTLYDRVIAVNSFGTLTVLFLALFAFLIDRPDAVDIAILYALINFVATIAILKFFRYRAFDLALARMGDSSNAPPPPPFLGDADEEASVENPADDGEEAP